MNLNPQHFAQAEAPEYDPVWGEAKPPADVPVERQLIDQAYLVFQNGAGAIVLQDLITRYLAGPIFDSARDAAKGFERNGEANVVRNIMARMADAQRRITEGR